MPPLSRTLLGAFALALAACTPSTDSPADGPAPDGPAADPATDVGSAAERAADRLPAALLGTYDTDGEACARGMTSARLTVRPDTLQFFYGHAVVDEVSAHDGGYQVETTLYPTEGAVEVVPEPTSYRIERTADGLRIESVYAGSASLVPCDGPRTGSADGAGTSGDRTETLRFAPGRRSATVRDTLRAAALHNYLVRASADQRLTATVEALGPGAPQPLVIRESTHRGPGDFDAVMNDEGVTSSSPTWTGTVPADGVYRVRVAHSGPSANAGTVSPYALTVGAE